MEITLTYIKLYHTKTSRTCIKVSQTDYIQKKKNPSEMTTEWNQI